MSDLSAFPIARRWPAQHPDRLQLYSLPTPNGVKVSIMLEEIGLPYEPHLVDIGKNEAGRRNSCRSIRTARSPRSSIPTARAASRWACSSPARSWSISPRRPASCCRPTRRARYETIQWVFFQMAGIGPMFGQLGYLLQIRRQGVSRTSGRCERFLAESKRLLGVLETRLDGQHWIMGDEFTIADVSLLGWVRNLVGFYGARELVDFDALERVPAWLDRGLARPAVQRGIEIPKRS